MFLKVYLLLSDERITEKCLISKDIYFIVSFDINPFPVSPRNVLIH